jgi:hypothetical protein
MTGWPCLVPLDGRIAGGVLQDTVYIINIMVTCPFYGAWRVDAMHLQDPSKFLCNNPLRGYYILKEVRFANPAPLALKSYNSAFHSYNRLYMLSVITRGRPSRRDGHGAHTMVGSGHARRAAAMFRGHGCAQEPMAA